MKRSGLPLATLGVLVLTAGVLWWSDWFTPRSHANSLAHISANEQHPSEAAMRYRQNYSAHWGCCLVKR